MRETWKRLAALVLALVLAAGPLAGYTAAEETDAERNGPSFAEVLIGVTADVENGGGYYTAHSPSRSFPRTAWRGIEDAVILTGGTAEVRLWQARPSFCSAAVYLAVMKALTRWDTEGTISGAAWAYLKPYGLDALAWPYQKDGMGCWGRANANGPGFAVFAALLGAGESRYLASRAECGTEADYWAQWEELRPGDVVKLFWNGYIGDGGGKQGESGHLVIFLGRETAYDDAGNRNDMIRYWSSNGSGSQLSGGYGKSSCPASKVARAVRTRITDPAAFDNARYIRPDDTDPYLSALDGVRLGTVEELKEALNQNAVSGTAEAPWAG